MKTTPLLFGFLIALTLTAAEPAKRAIFEVRLVRESASADTEPMMYTSRTAPDHMLEERLNIQKKPLLDRSALKSAVVQTNQLTLAPEILTVFTESGGKQFAEVTRQHAGQRMAFVIDGKVLSAPRVHGEITGGKAVLSGAFTEQEAVQLASRLNEIATK